MKIAVVYNRESKSVINLFGVPNRETYGRKVIKLISEALKKRGHTVAAFEGDKHLISNLERFMPRVVKGELPGLVFNLSYGIQGQARYTHVPGILEMIGIPYVGSNPLAHSLALDKVVAKMIFRQNGLPTPDFAVLEAPGFDVPDISFPMIVKPKNEAVSYGLKIVNDETELREGAQAIFDEYRQPVLVEKYIDGREINVGVIGNSPSECFPPVEIVFGEGAPPIYRYEDKVKKSGRTITQICPAEIPDDVTENARKLALKAFASLGCYDCARVDMRMDSDMNLYILEINSLPSLGVNASYVKAASVVGMDYPALVSRLVETASARYFGTPAPPEFSPDRPPEPREGIFSFLTRKRDLIEKRLELWCGISSRSNDPIGVQMAANTLAGTMQNLKMIPSDLNAGNRFSWMWTTRKGLEGGLLIVVPLDIPSVSAQAPQHFRHDPERLFGEGVGASRGSLVMLEFALRALKSQKSLHNRSIAVIAYADEGFDARYSSGMIRDAARSAGAVLVLRPGNRGDRCYVSRRGLLTYNITVEGKTARLGKRAKNQDMLLMLSSRLNQMSGLSVKSKRLSVSAIDINVDAYPMALPHRAEARLLVSYYDSAELRNVRARIMEIVKTNPGPFKWSVGEITDRSPMKDRKTNRKLADKLKSVARQWEIPFETTSSSWPSVAGLVVGAPVVCGMGPVAEGLYTPQESIWRISLIQRTLLLSQFILEHVK